MTTHESKPVPEPIPAEPFVAESRWPRSIGAASIVYAGFGILFMLLSLLGIFIGPMLQASLGGIKPVPVPPVLIIGQSSLVVAGLALGIILLAGGIQTCRRRPRGPLLIKVWVVGRLSLLLAGLVFAFSTIEPNLEYQKQVSEAVEEMLRERDIPEEQILANLPAQNISRQSMITWTISLTGAFAIYPIIAGVLLSSSAKREEIAGWAEGE